jgi:hypothetical protein
MYKEIKEVKAGDVIVTFLRDENKGIDSKLYRKEYRVAEVLDDCIVTTTGIKIYSAYRTNSSYYFKTRNE